VPLAEIVQQSRPNQLRTIGKASCHQTSRHIPVALIDHRLVEEGDFLSTHQPLSNLCQLGGRQWFRTQAACESAD
jgi:hypothetical protein